MKPLFHTGLGEEVADKHDALSAESGYDDRMICHYAPACSVVVTSR